jgi:hypothetical protein
MTKEFKEFEYERFCIIFARLSMKQLILLNPSYGCPWTILKTIIEITISLTHNHQTEGHSALLSLTYSNAEQVLQRVFHST